MEIESRLVVARSGDGGRGVTIHGRGVAFSGDENVLK